MKTRMNNFFKLAICVFALAFVVACDSDDDGPAPTFETPQISITSESTSLLKPGDPIEVTVSLTAEAGNQTLIVNRGGGILDQVALDETATSFTYTGANVSATLAEGDTEEYQFILVDTQDQQSSPAVFTADIAVYDMVDVKGIDVFNVDIPTDGLVPGGTDVKFASGREYYISNSLFFQPNSTFTVEEGVTIYLADLADSSVEVEMTPGSEAFIEGTANAPVVMTSENTIDNTAEPGDWDRFRLDGVQNSVVRYLRTEYADTGFRISDCDNTNTVEFIQVFLSAEEGFYISNGDLDFKYVLVTDTGDSGYRLGDDFSGTGQFLVAVRVNERGSQEEVYMRDNSTVSLANITLVGPGMDDESDDGLRYRGISAKVYSSIIADYPDEDIKVEDEFAPTDLNGDNVLAYSYTFRGGDAAKSDGVRALYGTFDANGDPLTNPFFNNALQGGPSADDFVFEEIAGIGTNDFVPDAEQTAKENFDPSTVNPAFLSNTFVGAIQNADNDWTTGWTKNADGSLR